MEKTAKVLAAGAGHLYGTSLPVGGTNTHAVISAHTGYDRLMFDRLSLGQGHVGDRFTIEVLGHTLAYRVTDIRVIDPDDFSVFGTDTADAPEREHSFLTGGEDSCDQVGLIIPPHPPNRRSVRSAARSGVTPTTTVCGRTGSRRWRASTYTCWTPRASACPATRP